MSEKKNVPKLRFPEFTEPWEQRKLGDMGSTFNGLSGKTKDDFGHGEAKFITYMNVFSNPIADLTMTESIEIDKKQKSVKAGDVFFTTSSETPDEVGMSSVMPEDADNIYLNSFCFGYRPTEKFDLNYLAYVLRADSFRKEMTFLAQGISRYNISKNKVMEVCIPVPTIEEQTKVGRYFRNLDHLITLHQRKLDHVKDLKKSMLQKMFPKNGQLYPEVRFPEFTDAWEQRKWIDTVDISTEMVDPTSGEYDDMPHIAPGNIESFTGRILDNVKTVKEEQLISGKFRFRPNDVVYGKINPQLGKYFYSCVNGLTSADAYVFNGKHGITQKFLFALLQTSDFFKYSVSVSKRSGMPKINRDELNAYVFLAPREEEQDKIGSFLLNIDHLITLHQRKLGAINLTNAIVLFDNGYNPALACELIILKGVLTYAKHHYQKQHVILRLL